MNSFDLNEAEITAIDMIRSVAKKVWGNGATLKVARGQHEPIDNNVKFLRVELQGRIDHREGSNPFVAICNLRMDSQIFRPMSLNITDNLQGADSGVTFHFHRHAGGHVIHSAKEHESLSLLDFYR